MELESTRIKAIKEELAAFIRLYKHKELSKHDMLKIEIIDQSFGVKVMYE